MSTPTTTVSVPVVPAAAPARTVGAAVRRYQIPADGGWHRFPLSGGIVHVGTRYAGIIEFWVLDCGAAPVERELRVFADEEPLPAPIPHHRGTVLAGRLAWHLMER